MTPEEKKEIQRLKWCVGMRRDSIQRYADLRAEEIHTVIDLDDNVTHMNSVEMITSERNSLAIEEAQLDHMQRDIFIREQGLPPLIFDKVNETLYQTWRVQP